MSSGVPSSGRVDHEEPLIPHGAMMATQSGFDVSAGTIVLTGVNVEAIGGYRSVVVQVKNNGTRDLTFTPEWDFNAGASHIRSTDAKIVPAGTSQRLLFQNQGDLLNKITVTGGGAGDTIDYYVAPSNLDPLPSSAPDYLRLLGLQLPVANPPVGDQDHAKFDAATLRTNDPTLWAFTLDAGGRIKEVTTSARGRYELYANFRWAAPAVAAVRSTLINVFGAGPIAMSSAWNTVSNVEEQDFLGAFTEMQSGTAQFNVQPVNGTAGALNFVCPFFWIVRFAI